MQTGDLLVQDGPLAALAVVGVFLLVSRWVWSTTHRERRKAALARQRDFGLLVPVLALADRAEAERQRDLLAANGVRATLAWSPPPGAGQPVRVTSDGHVVRPEVGAPSTQLLVFPADADRARALLTAG